MSWPRRSPPSRRSWSSAWSPTSPAGWSRSSRSACSWTASHPCGGPIRPSRSRWWSPPATRPTGSRRPPYIARQDYPGPIEVPVVDNGSTDGTRTVAEAYGAATGQPVRCVDEPRPGKSHALNTAAVPDRHRPPHPRTGRRLCAGVATRPDPRGDWPLLDRRALPWPCCRSPWSSTPPSTASSDAGSSTCSGSGSGATPSASSDSC
jgi:hypothetical protein